MNPVKMKIVNVNAMTRISWAEWHPGPSWKRGYNGTTQLPVSYKEGEVKHSAEGSVASALSVLNGVRQASWHFTLPKVGPVRAYQHYELEDICWHCGVPGDAKQDTSLIGNITLIGVEHEGMYWQPLTQWQIDNTIALSQELRILCPVYGMGVPELYGNLWEHNWLSNTACPSGRIPWDIIIPQLEDSMSPAQEAELKQLRIDVNTLSQQMKDVNAELDKFEADVGANITNPMNDHFNNHPGPSITHTHEAVTTIT